MPWLVALFGVLSLAALTAGLVSYLGYCRSTAKAWRDRVLKMVTDAGRAAEAERDALRALPITRRQQEDSLREGAWWSLMTHVSVQELEAFPGIGPATVGRLRAAGYGNLATMWGIRLQVPGLGEKRLVDVYHAIRELQRKIETRLASKGSPEGETLARQLREVGARCDEFQVHRRARLQAAEQVLTHLAGPAAAARRVTYPRFLWLEPHELLAPELLDHQFPDLALVIKAADDSIRSNVQAAARPVTRRAGPRAPVAHPGAARQAIAPAERVALERGAAARHDSAPVYIQDPQIASAGAAAQLLFAAARLAGPLASESRHRVQELLLRRWGQDAALANRVKGVCAQYAASAINLDECLRQAAQSLQEGERREVFLLACELAGGAAGSSGRAGSFLTEAARALGLPANSAMPPPDGSTGSPSGSVAGNALPSATLMDPRVVLEIGPQAPLSAEIIRRQYYLLTDRYAAEKFAGAGPEFVAVAQVKATAVTLAARSLLSTLGEDLELPAAQTNAVGLRDNPDLDGVLGG